MAAESLKVRMALVHQKELQDPRVLLQAIITGIEMIATKLDADAGVTDTNYRALLDAIVTL